MKRAILVGISLLLLLSVVPVMAAPLASTGTIHVVQPGQTLFSIARWYGVDVNTLAQANGITNPSFIYVGQRLTIPSGVAAPAPVPVPTTGAVHIVQPGEMLYGIAARYGVTAWAIAQANGIYNINHIYVGQRLIIPGVAPAQPAPVPTASPKPVTSSGSSGWRGEYYGSPEPTGAPIFVRNDAAIDFYWGLSSPDPRVPPDEFSVQWTRTINFRGGLYRFKVVVDDGTRVWIDGSLVLDAWAEQPEAAHTVDVTLSPGAHLVTVDYFDQADIAKIHFSFTRLGDAPAEPPVVVSTTTPTPAPGSDVPGYAWYGQYYNNQGLSGDPLVTRMDENIGFEWDNDAPMKDFPADFFSVHWARQVELYADNYEFCARADDGVQIFVDGTLVLDAWHPSDASQNYCNEVDIPKAGLHIVDVYYYEHGGEALVYVWWDRH